MRDLKLVKYPLLYYWQIGVFARDALGRIARQCQTTRWIIDWLWQLDIPFRSDPKQRVKRLNQRSSLDEGEETLTGSKFLFLFAPKREIERYDGDLLEEFSVFVAFHNWTSPLSSTVEELSQKVGITPTHGNLNGVMDRQSKGFPRPCESWNGEDTFAKATIANADLVTHRAL